MNSRLPNHTTAVMLGHCVLLSLLSACEGGSSGIELPPGSNASAQAGINPSTMSADQKACDKMMLSANGGTYWTGSRNIKWTADTNGLLLYGINGSIEASPAQGPQKMHLSAPQALANNPSMRPVSAPPSRSWLVHNGQFFHYDTIEAWYRYTPDGKVLNEYFPANNKNGPVLSSIYLSDIRETPLTGTVGNAPTELKSTHPPLYYQDNFFWPGQAFLQGAAYFSYQKTTASDWFSSYHCTEGPDAVGYAPRPCATGVSLQTALTQGVKTPWDRTYTWHEGSPVTLNGMNAWVTHQPISATPNPSIYYGVVFEQGGAIYLGSLTKAGTAFSFDFDLGPSAPIQYSTRYIGMNRAAFDSLHNAIKY